MARSRHASVCMYMCVLVTQIQSPLEPLFRRVRKALVEATARVCPSAHSSPRCKVQGAVRAAGGLPLRILACWFRGGRV